MSRSEPRSLCGGCAKPAEVPGLHVSPADAAADCSRCGFPTYLQLNAPAPVCTLATHDALKADVALFEESTTGRQTWAGLLTGQCSSCSSTLALHVCMLCMQPCASTDSIPWSGEDDVVHFGCLAERMLATGRTKFVVVVGGGQAREFARTVRA